MSSTGCFFKTIPEFGPGSTISGCTAGVVSLKIKREISQIILTNRIKVEDLWFKVTPTCDTLFRNTVQKQ